MSNEIPPQVADNFAKYPPVNVTNKQTPKRYACTRCGHETVQTTNHQGNTWSLDHFNCCPKCPPYAKYPEFGGQTIWKYVGEVPADSGEPPHVA